MPLIEPSPYDVLAIPATADVREIRLATRSARTAPKNVRYPLRQIQDSSALLRDPERRLEIDLQQLLPPDVADQALDLLAPILDEPLPRPGTPPPPSAAALTTLRRADLEADFAEPPVIGVGGEPETPARFTGGLSVLPHIEFPS
jgi:hypothetical protein